MCTVCVLAIRFFETTNENEVSQNTNVLIWQFDHMFIEKYTLCMSKFIYIFLKMQPPLVSDQIFQNIFFLYRM